MESLTDKIDETISDGLDWLNEHWSTFFDVLRAVMEDLYSGIEVGLNYLPFYLIALAAGFLGWWAVRLRFGIAAAISLSFCELMGLWPETMETLALVFTATSIALLIALPIGVLAGFRPRFHALLLPVLDIVQTLPPYIYLLPAIALLGFGPATALAATVVVAIPPALRLTSHGVRQTPVNFLELGHATGSSALQMFWKIRFPIALPSIMAGINQCLMMALGMVVIAGIVGSGGLGATIYDSVRTLNIGKSIDAGIAIVILTIILDRTTEGAMKNERRVSQ